MARMKEYTKWHLWTEKVNNLHIFTCQSIFFQWHITMDTSKDHIKMVINISDKNSQLLATPWRLLSHLDTWKWMLKGVRVSKAPRYLLLPGLLYGYILVELPVEPKGRFGWVKNEGWRCYKPEVCCLALGLDLDVRQTYLNGQSHLPDPHIALLGYFVLSTKRKERIYWDPSYTLGFCLEFSFLIGGTDRRISCFFPCISHPPSDCPPLWQVYLQWSCSTGCSSGVLPLSCTSWDRQFVFETTYFCHMHLWGIRCFVQGEKIGQGDCVILYLHSSESGIIVRIWP